MEILHLALGETATIGGKVRVSFLGVDGTLVRIGVTSPPSLPVLSEEAYQRQRLDRLTSLRLNLPLNDIDIARACDELVNGREVVIGQLLLRPDGWSEQIWSRDVFGVDGIVSLALDEHGCRTAVLAAATAEDLAAECAGWTGS